MNKRAATSIKQKYKKLKKHTYPVEFHPYLLPKYRRNIKFRLLEAEILDKKNLELSEEVDFLEEDIDSGLIDPNTLYENGNEDDLRLLELLETRREYGELYSYMKENGENIPSSFPSIPSTSQLRFPIQEKYIWDLKQKYEQQQQQKMALAAIINKKSSLLRTPKVATILPDTTSVQPSTSSGPTAPPLQQKRRITLTPKLPRQLQC